MQVPASCRLARYPVAFWEQLSGATHAEKVKLGQVSCTQTWIHSCPRHPVANSRAVSYFISVCSEPAFQEHGLSTYQGIAAVATTAICLRKECYVIRSGCWIVPLMKGIELSAKQICTCPAHECFCAAREDVPFCVSASIAQKRQSACHFLISTLCFRLSTFSRKGAWHSMLPQASAQHASSAWSRFSS